VYLSNRNAKSFIVYVYPAEFNQFKINDSIWQFPGMKFTVSSTSKPKISRGNEDPSIDITEELIDNTRLIKLTFDIPASFDVKNPLLVLTPIVQTKQ
jgi:hypothetical protein